MFVSWNPNINPVYSNLLDLVGDYICLRSVMPATLQTHLGHITEHRLTLSSSPTRLTTPNITLSDATALATATAWPTVVPTEEPQLPIAPGTLAGCTNYTNYRDTTVYNSFYQLGVSMNSQIANRCSYVASVNGIPLDKLLSWNPSLSTDQSNCTLATGYSYCVQSGNYSKFNFPILHVHPVDKCCKSRSRPTNEGLPGGQFFHHCLGHKRLVQLLHESQRLRKRICDLFKPRR